MKEITLGKLSESIQSLQVLANKPLKIKLAVELTRFLKSVTTELETFDELKKGLGEKWGELSEGGYKIEPENVAEFNREYDELKDTPFNNQVFIPVIKIDDLGDNFEIEPAHLMQLDWLIN